MDASDSCAEIPTSFSCETGEWTAVIVRNVVEGRSIAEIAVDGSQLVIAGGGKIAGRVNDACQRRRGETRASNDPPSGDAATAAGRATDWSGIEDPGAGIRIGIEGNVGNTA